jgi:hypothetical protein
MLNQFFVGGLTTIANITIHALVMTLVVYAAHAVREKQKSSSSLMVTSVMIATVSILMLAHAGEVLVWALAYWLVSAAPVGADLVYFAFVNYTTLGYGDVVPVERWRLLGPMTAMNGVLLFGWSTAVIFEVLRKAMATTSRSKVPN